MIQLKWKNNERTEIRKMRPKKGVRNKLNHGRLFVTTWNQYQFVIFCIFFDCLSIENLERHRVLRFASYDDKIMNETDIHFFFLFVKKMLTYKNNFDLIRIKN